ncbi:MAG: DeoR/GlpR family DNA-binding transcription regulator [bacterium]|nr:DeoR/GlpR family DNA-binding transcription regulator [bacterium]
MLAIERRNAIISKLIFEGKVVVSELAKEFDVTEETIRRDLEKLDNDGLAKKTYGGAVKVDSLNVDIPFLIRKQTNVPSKQKIASLIGNMINDGDYIMLDSSTTAMYVIKYIIQKKNITLITNSIEILIELNDKSDWNIISTGGTLKERGLSLVGYQAERMINNFRVDIAVCSCKGIDFNMGVSDSNEPDAQMKRAFFSSAKQKILAVDSTKFDVTSFTKVCDLSDVDVVVTENKPSESWNQFFLDENIKVVY